MTCHGCINTIESTLQLPYIQSLRVFFKFRHLFSYASITLSTGNHFFSANGRGVEQYGVHDTSVHQVKISQ